MRIEFPRRTLASEVVFSGVGIHSGEIARVTVRAGDNGIAFIRNTNQWQAKPENVTETTRSTTLGEIRMVEHLMSAFAAAEISDAKVEVEGEEMPILDGGAAQYLEGLQKAGVKEIGKCSACHLFGRVNLQDGPQRIGISVGTGRWRYEFERERCWPGQQEFEITLNEETYANEVAPAKTFAFADEIEALRNAGLGKGGAPENTLVIGPQGYLTESRFPDEAPRHKLLDCIGDLALSGIPMRFLNVVAERTGHKMNVQAAARLSEICEWED